MGQFQQAFERFARKTLDRERAVVNGVVNACLESIRDGSELTGAPGQPVSGDTKGFDLKPSWFRNRIGEHEWIVGSKLFYAGWIERGMLPDGKKLTLRSREGGFHSLELTVLGFEKLVDMVVADVKATQVARYEAFMADPA